MGKMLSKFKLLATILFLTAIIFSVISINVSSDSEKWGSTFGVDIEEKVFF